MSNEFSDLITDLKEQILYLQELGVDNFGVELPEFDGSKFKIQNSKLSVESNEIKQKFDLEKFVPDDDIFETTLKSVIEPANSKEKTETQNQEEVF